MKNVRENQLKTCIFLTTEELEEIMGKIFDTKVIIHCSLEGAWYETPLKDLDIDDDTLCAELSEYFDVNVTSMHIDDCEYVGVWVCYKQKATFTAMIYEDGGIITADVSTYDTQEEAIEFAKNRHWDEVVNDDTGEIVWRK